MIRRIVSIALAPLLVTMTLVACSNDAADAPTGDGPDPASPPAEVAEAFTPVEAEDPAIEDFFISVHDIKAGLDAGMNIVFVDARPALDFEFGHIQGAVHAPYFEVDQHLDRIPRGQWIVTYCECPHAEAGQAAQTLHDNGYRYVKVMEEGLAGWRDELQLPLVQGTPATEG